MPTTWGVAQEDSGLQPWPLGVDGRGPGHGSEQLDGRDRGPCLASRAVQGQLPGLQVQSLLLVRLGPLQPGDVLDHYPARSRHQHRGHAPGSCCRALEVLAGQGGHWGPASQDSQLQAQVEGS